MQLANDMYNKIFKIFSSVNMIYNNMIYNDIKRLLDSQRKY